LEYLTVGRKFKDDGETRLPVITFIHGAGGNALTWWRVLPAFTSSTNQACPGMVTPESGLQDYFAISISIRGFGASTIEGDNPIEHFKASEHSKDVLAVLDKEGVEQTALVGHSYGGFVCILTATEAPARVSQVVMVSTYFGLKLPEELQEENLRQAIQEASAKRDAKFIDEHLPQIKKLLSKENQLGIPDYPWEDQKTRLEKGIFMWQKKDPETWSIRWQIHQANHQITEMELLSSNLSVAMDPVRDLALDPDTFRQKYPGKLHFITCTDDGAVPWEIVAVLAEWHKADSCKILETGLGDHSLMFFSPQLMNKCLREALESSKSMDGDQSSGYPSA
jgi:pimeloyl-ACP methyl ester carboxylesterase